MMKNVFFKLPFHFNVQKLNDNLKLCKEKHWPLHFNESDFTGTWSAISLRSVSGDEMDILSTPNSRYTDTQLLQKCVYFREIVDSFKCEKEAIRLLSLSPNSYVKEHSDANAGYESGFLRIHIPIQTNPKVTFTVNKLSLPMREGECWYANFNLPHFVSNLGESDRIHLVIDAVRNDWTDLLFLQLGYDFDFEKSAKTLDAKTKLLMISELSLQNNEASKNLIKQLSFELERSPNT